MAELMEDDKVTIKEEISTVEDMCTVYVVGEDVKEESTENQGMVEHFLYNYIYEEWLIFKVLLEVQAFKPKTPFCKNFQNCLIYGKNTDFLRLGQIFVHGIKNQFFASYLLHYQQLYNL